MPIINFPILLSLLLASVSCLRMDYGLSLLISSGSANFVTSAFRTHWNCNTSIIAFPHVKMFQILIPITERYYFILYNESIYQFLDKFQFINLCALGFVPFDLGSCQLSEYNPHRRNLLELIRSVNIHKVAPLKSRPTFYFLSLFLNFILFIHKN